MANLMKIYENILVTSHVVPQMTEIKSTSYSSSHIPNIPFNFIPNIVGSMCANKKIISSRHHQLASEKLIYFEGHICWGWEYSYIFIY